MLSPCAVVILFLADLVCLQYGVAAFRLTSGCEQSCDESRCPTACISPVPDPCRCCRFVCAASEGQDCSASRPCEKDLSCSTTENGDVCTCREDDRMVCGNNDVTYASVCQFKKETASSNLTIKQWSPCESSPEIISAPESVQKLVVGEPLALDCEAKGFPIPVITWTFKGRDGTKKVLPSDDQLIAVQLRGGPDHQMVTSWVQIVETRLSDDGYYTCHARNPLGSVTAEAIVHIKHKS